MAPTKKELDDARRIMLAIMDYTSDREERVYAEIKLLAAKGDVQRIISQSRQVEEMAAARSVIGIMPLKRIVDAMRSPAPTGTDSDTSPAAEDLPPPPAGQLDTCSQ